MEVPVECLADVSPFLAIGNETQDPVELQTVLPVSKVTERFESAITYMTFNANILGLAHTCQMESKTVGSARTGQSKVTIASRTAHWPPSQNSR